MKVSLLHYSPLITCIIAARTCYLSYDKMDSTEDRIGKRDKELLLRLLESGHFSVFEHLVYTFKIEGISRSCLQQLTRHRISSYSVQSTRFTLKKTIDKFMKRELKLDDLIVIPEHWTEDEKQLLIIKVMSIIGDMARFKDRMRNDDLKYLLPECWKTNLVMTINARSLFNFFSLRTANDAHWEIRKLAYEMYKVLPEQHKFLFERFVKE